MPFLFLSGYGVRGLVEEFGESLVLSKPFNKSDLEQIVLAALAIDAPA